MSTEQRLLNKAGGAKNQGHVANNQRKPRNYGAQQKCTRARDTTRKQNNAK